MTRPPRLAAWLMSRSAPDVDRDAMLGDLAEEYTWRSARDGRRHASEWYWRQTRQSLMPNLKRRGQSSIVHTQERRVMTAFGQDVRLACRALVRRPLYSTIAVLSLAIGVGLSTGVFSLLDAAVLRPLALTDPKALRVVLEVRERGMNHNFTYPGFVSYRAAQKSFVDVVAYSPVEVALNGVHGSEMLEGEIVSGSYFSALGPRLALGRSLTDADNEPGAPPVIVLSAFEWQRQFGDAHELGDRHITLNGTPFAVVGVAAAPFRGMQVGRDAAFFAPIVHQPVLAPSGNQSLLTAETAGWITVAGRLRPEVTDEQASAELRAVGQRLSRTAPGATATFTLIDGSQGDSGLPASVGPTLQILFVASVLVMVVACANVAGLMLARAGDRRRELAVRSALGGGRWRLARMLLAEALVLGLAGTIAGVFIARLVGPIGMALLRQFGQPVILDLALNLRVIGVAIGAGLLTALFAGIAPVVRGWRMNRMPGLVEGGRPATASRTSRYWRRSLVVAQFALTFALVAAAGLLVRTLMNLRAMPTGLDTAHVLLVGANPMAASFDGSRMRDYVRQAVARLSGIGGVRAAGFAQVVPLGFGGSRSTIFAPGYTPRPDEDMEINFNIVSPGYFDATGIQLKMGRTFRSGLSPTVSPIEVVVNETLASRFWPGQPAIGRTLHFGGDTSAPRMEVVGVAADVKYRTLREAAEPSFYYSMEQSNRVRDAVFHVRAAGDPMQIAEAARQIVADVDRRVPISFVRALDDQRTLNVNDERTAMVVAVTLGGTALLLSAVGLFGAMAGLVAARTRELGVRLALGAAPGSLVRSILRDGLALAMIGGAIGIVLAAQLGGAVKSRLFGVGTLDPLSLAAALVLLGVVALAAAFIPARRVAKVDPVEVLRDN
ncbi:MAG TPA: ADOP family duplicated permease [Vicinamibacterales bacterium]|nr:ADOP family duplicated permease [Vicinamibacterales bacterium]